MLIFDEAAALGAVTMADAIRAMEEAFVALEQGEAEVFPVVTGHGGPATSFAIKSGVIRDRGLAGLKLGTYWPANRAAGLPSHGSTTLFLDTATGFPAALVSATGLTAIRTAAADAVAVNYLARPLAETLGIVGAGHQAWFDLLAICEVRTIRRVNVWNRNLARAEAFAARARAELGIEARAASLEETARTADILVTVTAAAEPLVAAHWIRPGTHVSAMGADAPGKQELDLGLTASAVLVADVVQQSLTIGEFQAAARAGLIQAADIRTLGAVILESAAPPSMNAITIFDSSGTAVQDLAIAALAIERGTQLGLGREIPLGAGDRRAAV